MPSYLEFTILWFALIHKNLTVHERNEILSCILKCHFFGHCRKKKKINVKVLYEIEKITANPTKYQDRHGNINHFSLLDETS
jgi:hypothetical protein